MRSITNIFKFQVIVYWNQKLLHFLSKKHKKNAHFKLIFLNIFNVFI